MDRATRLVRNPQVQSPAPQTQPQAPSTATPAAAAALMVDVVVLSADLALFGAIRDAVGERNPVWRARSAAESVDLLLTGRCGVLLIDMAAVSAEATRLIEQIVDQFPDIVVVVAGRREDESVLASLVSDGLVYRFMHKPLSPKRAGMFLTAAIRCHVERREGRAGERLLPLARELRARLVPGKWLSVGAGLFIVLALLVGTLFVRYGSTPEDSDAAGTTAAERSGPAAPLADPVLSRARAALAAGRLESPPGRNALDLYSAVLLTRPDDVEAREGRQRTLALLAERARLAAEDGDATEARRIADRVLKFDARHAATLAVLQSLRPPAPPAVAAPPTAQAVESAAPVVQAPRSAASARPVAGSVPAAAPESMPAKRPDPVEPTTAADERLRSVPVTRLPRAPVSIAASALSSAPTLPARVQPDPLTPRIVGPGVLPTGPAGPSQTRPPLTYKPTTDGQGAAPDDVRTSARPVPVVATEPRVDRRDLEPVDTPDPAYPAAALRARIEGWVELEYTVTEQGTTRDVLVVAGEPRGVFNAAAIDAVARWRYRPRIANGQPVAQRSSVTLRFNVDD